MVNVPDQRTLYSEIQKRLMYLIPEKWESIHLYASIVESKNKKTVGELYFYYIPKGLIKKKPINCYEIPEMFDIDEDEFSDLINKLYLIIKKLRYSYYKKTKKVWYDINISIENFQFKVEYGFENLAKSKRTSYERHIIWRYENLKMSLENFDRKERQIVEDYLQNDKLNQRKKISYVEGIYKIPNNTIIDYERVLTVDEAIERAKAENKVKKTKK